MKTSRKLSSIILTLMALISAACGSEDARDDGDSRAILVETMSPSTTSQTTSADLPAAQENTNTAAEQTPVNPSADTAELPMAEADAMNAQQPMPDSQEENTATEARPSLNLNLNRPADNELAFWKTRGSLNPDEDVVYYWTGHIFLSQDTDPNASPISDFPGPIMQFEGFNIARFEKVPGGIRMVSREMSLYKDMTGRILNCWNNRKLGVDNPGFVPVVHVFNDPVNHTISGGTAYVFGDNVTWNIEIMLRYPSALPVNQFSEYSAGNTYESSEMFNFYSKMTDLNDPELDSVPVTISWSRVGQFLPWMRAGQTPGKLIYHTNGQKLLGGFEELPQHLKDYVRANAPKYMTAPETDVSPNETSWRVFRKLLDAGEYSPECD